MYNAFISHNNPTIGSKFYTFSLTIKGGCPYEVYYRTNADPTYVLLDSSITSSTADYKITLRYKQDQIDKLNVAQVLVRQCVNGVVYTYTQGLTSGVYDYSGTLAQVGLQQVNINITKFSKAYASLILQKAGSTDRIYLAQTVTSGSSYTWYGMFSNVLTNGSSINILDENLSLVYSNVPISTTPVTIAEL